MSFSLDNSGSPSEGFSEQASAKLLLKEPPWLPCKEQTLGRTRRDQTSLGYDGWRYSGVGVSGFAVSFDGKAE